jgi:hypothetical protein
MMKKSVYQAIITMLILVIAVSVIGIVNTEISLKYETGNPKDCISVLTAEIFVYGLKISKSSS